MADVTLTTIDAMMKELYNDDKVHNVAVQKKPLYMWLNKRDGMVGDNMPVPVTYANGAGRAAVFADALANAAGGKHIKFNLTRASDYGVLTIDAETMHASASSKGAFVQARKWEVDGMLDQMGRSTAQSLYGSGYGILGRISSESTSVFTLTNAEDVRNFQVGQVLEAISDETATTVRAGTATVTALDPAAGTITLDSTPGAWDVAAPADYLITAGDADTATANKLVGLKGWIPLTAPTSGDSFFGQDRSVAPHLLAGERIDNTSASIEENLSTICEQIAANGGFRGEVAAFMSHGNFHEFVQDLGTQVVRDPGGKGTTGYESIVVHTSGGTVRVIPDPFCPSDRCYVLDKSTWTLHHMKPLPHIVMDDGLRARRQTSSDGIEIRFRQWAQLACRAPAYNGVFSI